MAMEVDIAIVGGGLGGMALALGLQERGIQAHVFEKAPQARKRNGTSILLMNNGTTTLRCNLAQFVSFPIVGYVEEISNGDVQG